MRIFQNTSIRRKQTLVIMLTSGIVLLLASAAFVAYDAVTFRRELVGNVSVLADAVGNNCAAAIDFDDPEAAGQMLAALHTKANIVSACVYSSDGQVFATYQRDTNAVFVPPAMQTAGQEFTGDQLHLFRSINQKGEMTGVIFVASDLKDLSLRLMHRLAIVGAVFPASLLVALLLSSRFQRLVSNPILNLARVARTVAQEKNYSLRAAKQGDDEIGELVDGFNEMLAQIQERGAALQSARDEMEMRVIKRTAELANERRLLRTLIDNLPDIVFAKDSRSRFMLANTACARQLGASRAEEVLGKTDADFVSPELCSQYLADEQALMQSGRPVTKEEPTQNRETGEIRESLTTKVPLKDDAGKVVGLVGIARDITERKRAEEALAVERNLLRGVIDLLPDCIYAKDTSHRFLLSNEACALLMGAAAPAELIGKTDADFYPSELEANFSMEELSVFKGVPLINKAEPATRPDGTREFILTTKVPLKDGSGKIIGLVGCARFITERKRAEEALQREHNLLRTLIDHIPDYIYVRDFSNRFVVANKSFARLMGVAGPSALIGKRDADFYPPEMAAQFDKVDQGVFAGHPILNRERVLLFPNGRELTILSTKVPLANDKGEVIGLIGVGRDITERKRTEAALAAEQRLLSNLITTIPDNIYFKDRESRFVRINEAFAQKHGFSDPSAAVGKTDFDLFGEQHARQAYADEQRILATGEPMIDKEEREDWKDGHVTWASSTKMPLRDAAGKIIGIMGISRDITERKRLEDHLIQSQKLETVGKLAGGIAHEFNSILTAIIGQAELLREDLPAGSPLAQNATAISQSADRAAILTRQLLAYGRKQFLRPEPLNLNQIITGMSGVLNHLMGGDTVAVSIVPAAGLKPVKADAGQIEQVIMNLAMNAREAMPGGGKLTLETANVTFGADDMGRYPELKPGGYVMLAISDTGRGMSENVKARAFEPFFTTKDVGQGTGLGLSTCYGIVKQSGGHINVYSEPGRGTTFKIYLPQVASLPQVPLERLESPELPRGTETILLVEDDPALREMAATLLRRLGYTVLAAANGVEALSLKQQNDTGHVDLLLTDVVMPHMSGRELADRVRALFPQTRILFTSAYTENAIAQQGGLDKGVALLQKPFTPSALARKVREMLDVLTAPKPESQTQDLEK